MSSLEGQRHWQPFAHPAATRQVCFYDLVMRQRGPLPKDAQPFHPPPPRPNAAGLQSSPFGPFQMPRQSLCITHQLGHSVCGAPASLLRYDSFAEHGGSCPPGEPSGKTRKPRWHFQLRGGGHGASSWSRSWALCFISICQCSNYLR